MLVQQVVERYVGRVVFVSENFGGSKLAERFGITRYPVVFVDDILFARPRDFGFPGPGEANGRYAPWEDAHSQERFRSDLARTIDLVLAGKKDEAFREWMPELGKPTTPPNRKSG